MGLRVPALPSARLSYMCRALFRFPREGTPARGKVVPRFVGMSPQPTWPPRRLRSAWPSQARPAPVVDTVRSPLVALSEPTTLEGSPSWTAAPNPS